MNTSMAIGTVHELMDSLAEVREDTEEIANTIGKDSQFSEFDQGISAIS